PCLRSPYWSVRRLHAGEARCVEPLPICLVLVDASDGRGMGALRIHDLRVGATRHTSSVPRLRAATEGPCLHARDAASRNRAVGVRTCHRRRRARHAWRAAVMGLHALRQSGLAPANLTTLAHFSVSETSNRPKSAGEPAITAPPRSESR